MGPKLLLVFFGLLALGNIEANQFLKKLHGKDLSFDFITKSGNKANSLLRKRRSASEEFSSEEVTSSEAADLMKFFVAAAWQEDKNDLLTGFITEFSDAETNITLIGWQRVYNAEGKVEEIRTIQIVIPPKPEDKPDNIVEDDDDDDYLDSEGNERELPYGEINEIKEMFEPMAQIGIPASVTMEEYDEQGTQEFLIYLDKDELYFGASGFAVYNKTLNATNQEVSDFITSRKSGAFGKPSVLKYDVDCNLILDQSNVKPQYFGYVTDEYEAPENVLKQSPGIIAQVSQQYHKDSIPKHLAIEFNKAFPEYKWRVLVDPENYHVTRDVAVELTYDNFDLDEESYVSYTVYGAKKGSKTK